MSERMTEQLLDLAVTEGWHMFPLIPGTKRPAVGDWEHRAEVPRHYAAGRGGILSEADQRSLAELLLPARDSGVACGPSGLVVIDLDTAPDGGPDGVQGLVRVAAEHGEDVPMTRLVRTRSGGWQMHYRAIPGREIRNSAGLIAPHVDVRGAGGYVVAPGSWVAADHKPGGWYVIYDPRPPVPLPRWLADLASPPRPARPEHSQGWPGQAPGGSAKARLRGLVRYALDAQEGTRNKSLYWSACQAAGMAAERLIDREAAAAAFTDVGLRMGLGEAEVRRTVDSAFRNAA